MRDLTRLCVVDGELVSWSLLRCHYLADSTSVLYRVMLLQDLLVPVFENGRLLRDYTLDEIRQRAEIDIVKSVKRKSSPAPQSNGTV